MFRALNRFSSLCGFWATALCSSSLLVAQYDGALPAPKPLAVGFDSITKEQSQDWLGILAGPGFEGRGTGQLGYVRAAHWVAGKAAEFGLEPMGDGGTYFQMLPMTKLFVDGMQSKVAGPGGLVIPMEKNVGLDRFPSQPELSGKLAFVRLVGDSPRFEEKSLAGRIVLYVADAKNEGRASFLLGQQRAIGVLQVTDKEPQSTPQLKRGGRTSNSAAGTISRVAATLISNAAGVPLTWMEMPDNATMESKTVEDSVTLQIRLREEPVAVPNVIAWQRGSDPSLNSEYVVIGAHLDHLGLSRGEIHPGADDNGSGSTALLNIAKAMATNPVKPKRSVLFLWFAAEEIGLVGSAHYCNNPVLPLDKMVCMLNIDMVGRNEEKGGDKPEDNLRSLHLVGSQKGDKSLHDVIMEANKHVNLEFEFDEEGVFGRSDQANFFKKGISVAFLFGGFHPDYHRPTDLPSRINYDKIAAAAKLFYLTAHLAAEKGPMKVPAAPATPEGAKGEAAKSEPPKAEASKAEGTPSAPAPVATPAAPVAVESKP